MRTQILSSVLCLLIILSGCNTQDNLSYTPQHGNWGLDIELLSNTISPGDNFYAYVNEKWQNQTAMPAGYAFYSEPWVVQDKVIDEVDVLIDNAVRETAAAGTPAKRVGDLYRSFMDSSRIEQAGLDPVQADIARLLSLKSHEDIARWMANPRASSIFHLLVQPPVDMQGGYVLTLAQYRVTGLGLPGQIYYKSNEAPYPAHREAYVRYIAEVFRLAGVDQPGRRAQDVLDLETRYANIMWDFAKLRDAGAAFNLINADELPAYAPGFPWQSYFDARGLSAVSRVNIGVGALQESAALFREIPVSAWVSFHLFHWINNHAAFLPEVFGQAAFAFYDAGLWGVETRQTRKERATELVQRQLGDDIGAMYVNAHFVDESRDILNEMVTYIRAAFREILQETPWMDEATRREAQAKLDAIIVEVAEPQAGIDWATLATSPDDLMGNYANIKLHQWEAQRQRIGKPLTRFGDWNMHPHRIGMGYHQQYNKIFITAGALLPPFFDPAADPAVNFGAVGQTLAHEFGHALDDQGSKFDRNGALRNWWTPEARAAYETQTQGLIDQFKQYETLPGVYLASDQMIGEIVGDLTGTLVAYKAAEAYMQATYGDAPPVLDGFTWAERFFISGAQQARTIATEDALRDAALHRTHPPAEFRVNGVVRNLDVWYETFGVKSSDSLYYPAFERIKLW